jgi:purine-binding chemotaxis protein CheW
LEDYNTMNTNDLVKAQETLKQTLLDAGNAEEEVYADGHVIQLVSFTLDDVEYGLDILRVHEILRIPEITRLPNTPNYIRGVINLRGNVIPVVDVRDRFGFVQKEATENSRIIVIESEGKQIGLYVDNVSQVIRINNKNIDPPSDLIEGVSEVFIEGIGRLKNSLIVILNMKSILFDKNEKNEKDNVCA